LCFVDLMSVCLVLCSLRFDIVLLCFSPGFSYDDLSTSQEIGWEKHLQYCWVTIHQQ